MKKLIFALIAVATAVGSAQAADAYVGVGVTTVDHTYNLSGTDNGSSAVGYKASGKVFGGYNFDQNFGVEAGYTDFRKSGSNYTVSGTPGRAVSDSNSFYVAGKATAPINDLFSVYGKLGAARNRSTLSSADMAAFNQSESKTEVYAGVGVQYKLNQKVAFIAEFERFGKNKDFGAKSEAFTVGAKYAF